MLKVFHEGDHVILDLCGRKRSVLLTPLGAVQLADSLRESADRAELEPKSLVEGQVWNCFITNMDRQVVMHFRSPDSSVPERVPLPPKVARAIADLLYTNANMAGYGLRITVKPR